MDATRSLQLATCAAELAVGHLQVEGSEQVLEVAQKGLLQPGGNLLIKLLQVREPCMPARQAGSAHDRLCAEVHPTRVVDFILYGAARPLAAWRWLCTPLLHHAHCSLLDPAEAACCAALLWRS